LYGIALVETIYRPFMFEFRLIREIDTDKIPTKVEVKIGEANFIFEYVPRVKDANIGEEAIISIKRTRWRITPDQVNEWMKL